MSQHNAFITRLASRFTAVAACTLPLALTALPAAADTVGLERVEISGKVYEGTARHDVRESCQAIDTQLQNALQTTWLRERQMGQVQVQLVLEGGQVSAVSARGISVPVARSVRRAVEGLQCTPLAAAKGPQVYHFHVDFTDPYSTPAPTMTAAAAASAGYRVALLNN
ncbi:hypothetical protein [Roseateles sp. BYS87W]|uniref:TonB C-terminal domain-containing protein n=1 Tax=Pelomonas baiyunensis TaxID=3299026 RepID=A0ABW7H4E5_9BURK